MATRRGLVAELWDFMRTRRKWSHAPIISVMMLEGPLLHQAQVYALAPIIYTIFSTAKIDRE
jgi:hypothetical protein